jgi:putative aldouronate transport system permease protein
MIRINKTHTNSVNDKELLPSQKRGFHGEIKRNAFLYGMTVPGILFIFIFSYLPMAGLVMAFQNFNVREGFGSPFCGLDNFKFFFNRSIFQGLSRAAVNTLWLNVLFIIATTFTSILLAVAFSEIHNKKYSKVTQTLSLLPYFISWAIISLFVDNALISSDVGIITKFLAEFGIKINFYTAASIWPFLLIILKVWQGSGYGSIIYLATITGIDPQIMEAAEIDGASKWYKIRFITLPILMPTIVLMTLFSVGRIFYGDFGMIYALIGDNSMLYSTTDVIDTYVYRAMRNLGQYGLSTAIGMIQSILGFLLVMTANGLARKIEPDSAIF